MEHDLVKTRFELSNLLTDEMISLVNNGMGIEYEAYVSIIAIDKDNRKTLYKTRIRRKIKFDYLNSSYNLSENGGDSTGYSRIKSLIEDARKFEARFDMDPSKYSTLDFFIEIRLIENPLIENNFKIKTSDLWNGYKPSIKFICDSKGNEF